MNRAIRMTLSDCIGRKLGEALLDYAKSHGVKRIFLEGNTRLEASIALYRKLGFREIPLEGNAYERCDILMEIKL
jgi:ribosomal protein S18 acetylase RimI-like enzyme